MKITGRFVDSLLEQIFTPIMYIHRVEFLTALHYDSWIYPKERRINCQMLEKIKKIWIKKEVK